MWNDAVRRIKIVALHRESASVDGRQDAGSDRQERTQFELTLLKSLDYLATANATEA